jgi:hypothetical protein
VGRDNGWGLALCVWGGQDERADPTIRHRYHADAIAYRYGGRTFGCSTSAYGLSCCHTHGATDHRRYPCGDGNRHRSTQLDGQSAANLNRVDYTNADSNACANADGNGYPNCLSHSQGHFDPRSSDAAATRSGPHRDADHPLGEVFAWR